jgi:hypothetical protein
VVGLDSRTNFRQYSYTVTLSNFVAATKNYVHDTILLNFKAPQGQMSDRSKISGGRFNQLNILKDSTLEVDSISSHDSKDYYYITTVGLLFALLHLQWLFFY